MTESDALTARIVSHYRIIEKSGGRHGCRVDKARDARRGDFQIRARQQRFFGPAFCCLIGTPTEIEELRAWIAVIDRHRSL